jgi:heme exporter protein A
LTGLENLSFYASLYGFSDPAEVAGKQLRRMGLESARNRLAKTYSSGMKQRLSIARALIHNPSLLLLDEPYSGLDQHGSRLLTELLKELKEESTTVLLITHSVEEGLTLANRVMVMNRGRLALSESCSEAFNLNFKSLYFELVEG